MFSRIRKRCTYANVAATMALFFAMSGGALAAGHYLITSTKQIKPSVLSSLKGKAGPAGKNGTIGANGAQGPTGATGPQGPAGSNGSNGANGESVTSVESAKAEIGPCKKGGSEFKIGSATPTYACNGSGGSGGGGLPAILPAGKTETGTWVAQTSAGGAGYVPISFTIPLAAALNVEGCGEEPATRKKTCQLHLINKSNKEVIRHVGEFPNEGPCSEGTAVAPKAEVGTEPNLCLYEVEEAETELRLTGSFASFTSSPTGPVLEFISSSASNESSAYGTWAVTAGSEG
jgi:Collagen triple helix repeat (20 copies)